MGIACSGPEVVLVPHSDQRSAKGEIRRANFMWCLKRTLNPHPSMNQMPKGAAPEIVLVGYELRKSNNASGQRTDGGAAISKSAERVTD
jgi:hypothetical protein